MMLRCTAGRTRLPSIAPISGTPMPPVPAWPVVSAEGVRLKLADGRELTTAWPPPPPSGKRRQQSWRAH